MIELLDNLKDQDDIVFFFFDNKEKGLFGSSQFAKNHSTSDKLIINFDCVGDSDHILAIPHKNEKAIPKN